MLEFIGLTAQQQSSLSHASYAKQFGNHNVVVFSCHDQTSLAQAFSKKAHFYIDAKAMEHHPPCELQHAGDLGEDFVQLTMQSDTAYYFPLCLEVARHICQRYSISGTLSHEIETALHEATTNALIHGNLGLSTKMESLDDFGAYYRELECRIHDKKMAEKLIHITFFKRENYLTLMVSDQGVGFDIPPDQHTCFTHKLQGNGQFLMKYCSDKLHYHDGGSSVEIHFNV